MDALMESAPVKGSTTVYENPRPGDYNAWTERKVERGSGGKGEELLERLLWYGRKVAGHSGLPGNASMLQEALVNSPDAQNMLRDGIRLISYDHYADASPVWPNVVDRVASNTPSEEFLIDGSPGILEEAPSGTPAPQHTYMFEGAKTIYAKLYRGLMLVTGDEIRYDRIGIIARNARRMAMMAVTTSEAKVFEQVTTTSNYSSTKTNGNNDVGANTSSLGFSLKNLATALATISTAKDKASGQYLMLKGNCLVVAPRLEWAVRQAVMSTSIERVGKNSTASQEVYGTGTRNPFTGLNKVIVTPYIGDSYEWALFDDTRNGLVYTEVEPYRVFQESQNINSESWLVLDAVRYLSRLTFGIGMVDSRSWYFSNSTTEPTVD